MRDKHRDSFNGDTSSDDKTLDYFKDLKPNGGVMHNKPKMRVYPITKKMKSKVKEHGDIWLLETVRDGMMLISTINNVHDRGRYPYSVWITDGVEAAVFDLEDTI